MVRKLTAIFFGFVLAIQIHAQKTLSVLANKPIAEISPAMWGVFFEDINFAADGGLYAELIKNRSFEFYKTNDGVEGNKTKRGEWKNNHYQYRNKPDKMISEYRISHPIIKQCDL